MTLSMMHVNGCNTSYSFLALMHFPTACETDMAFDPEAEQMQTYFRYIQEEREDIARL